MSTIVATVDLVTLAGRANQAHRDCELSYGSALAFAFDAGTALLQAKANVGHGEWLPWLAENIEFDERVAQRYMRLAEHREVLKAKGASDLGIEAALKQISTPRPERQERKLSAREMGDAFRGALPAGGATTAPAEPVAGVAWSDAQLRKDGRATELLLEAKGLQDTAQDLSDPRGVARAYRDAAIKAHRAAALLDELAISFER